MANTDKEVIKGMKVKLLSCDGEGFEVDESVAFQSLTIKDLIGDIGNQDIISLPNVPSLLLVQVIKFCEYHRRAQKTHENVQAWNAAFLASNEEILFELITAASYLNIRSLIDLTCKRVADRISGKNSGQLRAEFDIVNDLTPEEEQEYMKENSWAFE